MALAAGTRLGPYEVLGLMGAGGMGEVYRARDTRLDRSVAIKVLPADLASDAERRTRFEREARTISALNHPHICTLHDVGDHDGVPYLVMEHLAGETLAERLKKGPLPLDQVLDLGAQVADALSAAHTHGIVHRDLKPANVMLTKSGVKLLDFGLAKPHAHDLVGEGATRATVAEPLTERGVILGTVPYMAPEQLEGREADARSDLWALGAILYEMLTGQRAFEGSSQASLISAIMSGQPAPVSTLQPLTPPALERVVRKCLAKAPDDRWDTAHDVADELRWIAQTSGRGSSASGWGVAAAVVPGRWRRWPVWALVGAALALLGTAVGAGLTWRSRLSTPPAALARVSLEVQPADELDGGGVSSSWLPTPGGSRTALAWTPDGQTLVFVGRRGGVRQLYVRRLDAAEARPLPHTEGAQVPALAPDGASVTFWAGGAIRRVPLTGGPAGDLASDPAMRVGSPPWGMACDASGRVFLGGESRPLWAIPAQGAPSAATTLGATEVSHGLPWLLPGDQTLLYTVRRRHWSWGDEEIVAQTLATGARKTLLQDAADARYVPTGHLVFLRRGVLLAVPFDAERVEIRGAPVPVLEGVAQALTGGFSNDVTGAGQFALSPTGTLAWVPSPVVPGRDATLVTVDRRGQVSPLGAPVRSYDPSLRLAPDGHRLAVSVRSLTEVGLWVYDLDRGSLSPLNRSGEATWPVWSPDGSHLAFSWLANGRESLALQPADGSAPPRVIAAGRLRPSSFTPDGRHVAAVTLADTSDIIVVTDAPGTPAVRPLIQTPNNELWPVLSPDGHWLAYGSNVSDRYEIYVRRYPELGAAQPASLEGGVAPAWHPNGRDIFFLSPRDAAGKQRMMAAAFGAGSPPRLGRPQVLFEFDARDLTMACVPVRCYDVAPDGSRFYAVQYRTPPPPPPVTHINLIQNWIEELKAKVPTR